MMAPQVWAVTHQGIGKRQISSQYDDGTMTVDGEITHEPSKEIKGK